MASNLRRKYLIFQPEKLSTSRLPTNSDVVKGILFERSVSDSEVSEICKKIVHDVETVWSKTKIPRISHKSMLRKVNLLQQKYTTLLKSSSSKHFERYRDDFIEQNNSQLFDIAQCQCKRIYECKCVYTARVPQEEKEFLVDQRTCRNMCVRGNTIYMAKTKQVTPEPTQKSKETSTPHSQDRVTRILKRNSAKEKVETPRKRLKLTNTALMLDKCSISNRAAANVINAFAKDVEESNGRKLESAVDKNKVRRARVSARKMVSKQHMQSES